MILLELDKTLKNALSQGFDKIAIYIIIALIIAAVLGMMYFFIERKLMKSAEKLRNKRNRKNDKLYNIALQRGFDSKDEYIKYLVKKDCEEHKK